jgi:hypothetical protein
MFNIIIIKPYNERCWTLLCIGDKKLIEKNKEWLMSVSSSKKIQNCEFEF